MIYQASGNQHCKTRCCCIIIITKNENQEANNRPVNQPQKMMCCHQHPSVELDMNGSSITRHTKSIVDKFIALSHPEYKKNYFSQDSISNLHTHFLSLHKDNKGY